MSLWHLVGLGQVFYKPIIALLLFLLRLLLSISLLILNTCWQLLFIISIVTMTLTYFFSFLPPRNVVTAGRPWKDEWSSGSTWTTPPTLATSCSSSTVSSARNVRTEVTSTPCGTLKRLSRWGSLFLHPGQRLCPLCGADSCRLMRSFILIKKLNRNCSCGSESYREFMSLKIHFSSSKKLPKSIPNPTVWPAFNIMARVHLRKVLTKKKAHLIANNFLC